MKWNASTSFSSQQNKWYFSPSIHITAHTHRILERTRHKKQRNWVLWIMKILSTQLSYFILRLKEQQSGCSEWVTICVYVFVWEAHAWAVLCVRNRKKHFLSWKYFLGGCHYSSWKRLKTTTVTVNVESESLKVYLLF